MAVKEYDNYDRENPTNRIILAEAIRVNEHCLRVTDYYRRRIRFEMKPLPDESPIEPPFADRVRSGVTELKHRGSKAIVSSLAALLPMY